MFPEIASRTISDLTLEPLSALMPHCSLPDLLTPRFNISVEGEDVGYISRGHALLWPEYRGNGYFACALAQLESFERHLFEQGKFSTYCDAILEDIGIGARVVEHSIRTLSEPHYIDFWRIPDVAACGVLS